MKGNIQWHTAKNCAIQTLLSYGASTLRVYKGTIPTSAAAYTVAGRSTDLLITYTIATGAYVVNATNKAQTYMATFPAAVAATASGTATWFAIDATANGLSETTLFLIDGVTDTTGTVTLKLLTTTIVSGTSYDLASLAFELKH